MTKEEFDAEKRLQGANVGAKVGNMIKAQAEAQEKNQGKNNSLPEDLSGKERAY